MKRVTRKTGYLAGALLLAALTLSQLACDGSSTLNPPKTKNTYDLYGTLVKDPNLDSARVLITLLKNDTAYGEAAIKIGGDSLGYSASAGRYVGSFAASEYPTGSYLIEVRDSSVLFDTLFTLVPGDVNITSVAPPNRIKTTADDVKLTWTASANSEGYVIAAVKRENAYTGDGYAEFVESQVTLGTFPNDAFSFANGDPDTGWYYVYVYSYTENPYVNYSNQLLPTVFTTFPIDTATFSGLTGNFGSIVVSPYDSVHVVVQ